VAFYSKLSPAENTVWRLTTAYSGEEARKTARLWLNEEIVSEGGSTILPKLRQSYSRWYSRNRNLVAAYDERPAGG